MQWLTIIIKIIFSRMMAALGNSKIIQEKIFITTKQ
jgi:hypothetical protein